MAKSSTRSCRVGFGYAYDVFLSFRGDDTRKNFTDHLFKELLQAGIHTFQDNKLPRGEEISPQLLKAIEESMISIVVFSKRYASSTWCLDELAKIMECKNTTNQIIFPIFYDVDPSDIRKQTGSFAEDFMVHVERFNEETEKVNRWRKALKEAANLCGYSLKDMENGHEAAAIQNIVLDVSNKLNRKYLHVAKFPVGIDSRVGYIIDCLRAGTNDVRVVGIHGMPGIGKTTIAKEVFNQLYNRFEGSCFLKNVAAESQPPSGLVQLQEQLLCEILKQGSLKISNEDRGIHLIQERLCCKRVLVVLDDVEQQKQLDALVGDGSWFGLGSIIIITTRNEDLLNTFEVVVNCQVKIMKELESLQLFSWHAFNKSHPIKDYVKLSNEIVKYCGGLPLALEVLGSSLRNKSEREWRGAIEKLQKIPHHEIQRKLRISFETLDDDTQKGMFLDIACFFVGRNKEYVAKILDGRGFFPDDGIGHLINRSLITINHENEISMHDLLRDMGREIIREMSPGHLGKRSRIWFHEDAWDLLNKKMGTEIVEGVTLDVRASEVVPLSTDSFANMGRLNLLQINGAHLIGSFKLFSKELIWLCWLECPLKSLPSDFMLDNLVVLDMQYSNVKELWKKKKILNKLKVLDLSYSKLLVKAPNLHSSSLEKLILKGCSSLVEVHQSIGHLKSLVFFNLEGCYRLKNLPESMGDLKSLETLNINMCSELKNLPECLGGMESLRELLANGTAIQRLPSSIGNLKGLLSLNLEGCWGLKSLPESICEVKTLQTLNISGCSKLEKLPERMGDIESLTELLADGIENDQFLSSVGHLKHVRMLSLRGYSFKQEYTSSLKTISSWLPTSFTVWRILRDLQLGYCSMSEGATSCVDFGSLSSLITLDLSGNKFLNLPAGIGSLPKLQSLCVTNCKNLVSISELPSSLGMLIATNCTSMERVRLPILSKRRPPDLCLSGCQKLINIQGIEGMDGTDVAFHTSNSDLCSLSNNYKRSLVEAFCKGRQYHIAFAGGEMPNWFSYSGEAGCSTLSFCLPPVFEALVVWVAYDFLIPTSRVIIRNESNGIRLFDWPIGTSQFAVSNCLVSIIRFSEEEMEGCCAHEWKLSVEDEWEQKGKEIKVEKCGVHVIVEKTESGEGTTSPRGETNTVIPAELYHHRLHHPFLGSITASTYQQWKNYLLRELSGWHITCTINTCLLYGGGAYDYRTEQNAM